MFDEMAGETKVCIKRNLDDSIFIILIFGNIIYLAHGMMFEICYISKGLQWKMIKTMIEYFLENKYIYIYIYVFSFFMLVT